MMLFSYFTMFFSNYKGEMRNFCIFKSTYGWVSVCVMEIKESRFEKRDSFRDINFS